MKTIEIIKKLNDRGYEAFKIGGCVRDHIMKREAHDIDIATDAMPEEVMAIFPKAIPTGIKHGTVTVDGFEVTTYRIDGKYEDGRHPEDVTFTRSLEEDTKRRDFTINAMAMDKDGKVIDFHGGVDDIRHQIIRTVGDPVERFNEDALRILRAVRFSSQLGFMIEIETREAMLKCRKKLHRVSGERVFTEIKKILEGDYVEFALRNNFTVLAEVIPEIRELNGFKQNNPHHIYDVWEHTIQSVKNAPKELRLVMLLHDIGKPSCYTEKDGIGHFYGHPKKSKKMARNFFKRMKADRKTIDETLLLIENHDINTKMSRKTVKKYLNTFGEETFRNLLKVRRADVMAQSELSAGTLNEVYEIEKTIDSILKEKECFTIKDMAVNGKDVISCGFSEGREVGDILNKLLDKVMTGELENDRESLMAEIRRNYADIRKD